MATIKQKVAFEKTMENHGNVTAAMKEAGYSDNTVNKPKDLTESDGWKELVKDVLSIEKLTKKHEQLLKASDIQNIQFHDGETDDEIKLIIEATPGCKLIYVKHIYSASDPDKVMYSVGYFHAPDNKVQKDALDMGYKLNGSYAPEKSLNVNLNVDQGATDALIKLANSIGNKIEENYGSQPTNTRETSGT